MKLLLIANILSKKLSFIIIFKLLFTNVKRAYAKRKRNSFDFLKPIDFNKYMNSDRVGKFIIESAKYS